MDETEETREIPKIRKRPKRRVVLMGAVGVGVLVAGGAVAVLTTGGHSASAAAAGPSLPVGSVRVVRTDLSSSQQAGGALGYLDTYTVALPGGSSSAASSQASATAQSQASAAQTQLATARKAVADARAVGDRQVTQALTKVNVDRTSLSVDQGQLATDQKAVPDAQAARDRDCGADAASPACAAAKQAVTAATGKVAADNAAIAHDQATITADTAAVGVARGQAQQAVDQAQGQVDQLNGQIQGANDTLSSVRDNALGGRAITSVPAVGTVVDRGQSMYWLDGNPVPLLFGTQSVYRAFGPGMSDGPDVTALQQNLIALGVGSGVTANGHFGSTTRDAVIALQKRLGEPQTGSFALGQVVFLPGAARITNVAAPLGSQAQPGATVLTATSTTEVVVVPLQVNQEYLVHPGDKVTINLPDGKTTTTGRVSAVSQVASAPGVGPGQTPASPSGGGGQSSPAAQQQNGNTTVPVTITLDDPHAIHGLDQAPVTVDITDQSVQGVLAVPVQALLALAGGGYGVRKTDANGTHLVAVTTGLFAGSLVQVSGSGLAEGDTIEVPTS